MLTRSGYRRRTGALFLAGNAARMVARSRKVQRGVKAVGRFVKKNMNPYVGSSLARKLGTTKGRFQSTSRFVPKRNLIATSDKIEEDIGTGGQEMTTIKRTVRFKGCGKKIRTTKLEKACRESEIYRIQGVSPFMNTTIPPINALGAEVGGGAYWLHNYQNSSSNVICPLHVYDLTAMNNTQVGTITKPNVGWRMAFTSNNNPGAGVQFLQMDSYSSNGTLQGAVNWVPENVGGSNNDYGIYPEKSALQEWVDINLLCYGSANMATKFKVAIVQTKEDFLAPQIIANNTINPTPVSDPQTQLIVNTYESLVAPYIKHPIDKQYYNRASKVPNIKILKELDFIQQPRLNTETDAAVGHCKQVKLFVPLNRINRYDWGQFSTDSGAVGTANSFITEVGANNTNLHPKARIYLLIMALNTTRVTTPSVPSVNFTPSYDLMIRTKYSTMR